MKKGDKTGITYQSTEIEQPQYLPTKHGYEYFVFRPLKLNMDWVAMGNKIKIEKG